MNTWYQNLSQRQLPTRLSFSLDSCFPDIIFQYFNLHFPFLHLKLPVLQQNDVNATIEPRHRLQNSVTFIKALHIFQNYIIFGKTVAYICNLICTLLYHDTTINYQVNSASKSRAEHRIRIICQEGGSTALLSRFLWILPAYPWTNPRLSFILKNTSRFLIHPQELLLPLANPKFMAFIHPSFPTSYEVQVRPLPTSLYLRDLNFAFSSSCCFLSSGNMHKGTEKYKKNWTIK